MEFSFVIFRIRDHNRVRYWSPFGTTTWVLKKCEFQKPGKVMRREREGGGGEEREKEDEGMRKRMRERGCSYMCARDARAYFGES